MAKGDVFTEETSDTREAVVEGFIQEDVLHRILYSTLRCTEMDAKKKTSHQVPMHPRKVVGQTHIDDRDMTHTSYLLLKREPSLSA